MTPTQLKTQGTGLALALATAVGCLAYERIAKSFSFFTVGFLACLAYVPFFIGSLLLTNQVQADWSKLAQHKLAIAIYLASGVTGPCWYLLTRRQNVMVGAVFEIKYILMLALFYLVWGTKPMTLNTAVGVALALASIYFISK